MKIAIIACHHWPIPTPVFTGDIVILDLAIGLHALGHEVVMVAPAGTQAPGQLCATQPALGAGYPDASTYERAAWLAHRDSIEHCDMVHDFSICKTIAEFTAAASRPAISTLLGGNYSRPEHGRNICVWSNAMRERALRGATDYEGTKTPDLAGPPTRPIKDARVIFGGVDTDFYTPGGEKGTHLLWLNRWHPAKGFAEAIDRCLASGEELVMSGQHPGDLRWPSEAEHARAAVARARGASNIRFQWLPKNAPEHHIAKREMYRNARALLYPVQFQEPFGLSMAEALACGTPVIHSGLGSCPEVCGDAITPSQARARASQLFSRRAMAERYLQVYRDVCEGATWGGRL